MINFRGLMQIHIPALWSVIAPPRVQVFLWLVFYNEIMTGDNLKKRNTKKSEQHYEFYSDLETVHIFFFERVVAKQIWRNVSPFLQRNLGTDMFSISISWIASKLLANVNSICAAVLWSLWKFSNNMIFNHHP